jgi:branched-chain amino acid transport system permease protein
MDFDMKLVDRLVVMNFGSKLMEGDPAAVRRDAGVQAAYLGGDLAEEQCNNTKQAICLGDAA